MGESDSIDLMTASQSNKELFEVTNLFKVVDVWSFVPLKFWRKGVEV